MVYDFYKNHICFFLPVLKKYKHKFVTLNNLSWNIATAQFIFNSFESWKGSFAWAVSDHQAKE